MKRVQFALLAFLVCLASLPADAQRYATQRDGDIVHLIDTGTDTRVSIAPSMSPAGARQSRFFNCFDVGGAGCPSRSHVGYMSLHELRLIAEWLDIGAQYYNNPFDVPVM